MIKEKQFRHLAHILLIIRNSAHHFAATAKLSNWLGSKDRVPMATQPFLGVRTTAFSHSWYPFSCPDAYWPFGREKEIITDDEQEMLSPLSKICYRASRRSRYLVDTNTPKKEKKKKKQPHKHLLCKTIIRKAWILNFRVLTFSAGIYSIIFGMISANRENKSTFPHHPMHEHKEKAATFQMTYLPSFILLEFAHRTALSWPISCQVHHESSILAWSDIAKRRQDSTYF